MDFRIVGEGGNAVLQTIHASEGGRAIRLLQQRQKMQQHLQEAKEKLETKGTKRKNINWGGSAADRLEEQFKKETVGLVSAEDFKVRRAKLEEQIKYEAKALFTQKFQEKRKFEFRLAKSKLSFCDEQVEEVLEPADPEDEGGDSAAETGGEGLVAEEESNERVKSFPAKLETASQRGGCRGEGVKTEAAAETPSSDAACALRANVKKNEEAVQHSPTEAHTAGLSDAARRSASSPSPADPAGGTVFKIRKRIGKDPSVDTSYLPDKERDAQLAAERQQLIEEYRQKEEREKRMPLCVTYSYWDGTGHRRRIQVLRGSTVGEFLATAKRELEREFVELRSVATENLMYVKEDLILPHVRPQQDTGEGGRGAGGLERERERSENVTFFELIKSKARGKSGPLFHFDAHDDVRVFNDVRTEKEDSHAGKIVDKKCLHAGTGLLLHFVDSEKLREKPW
ncbi:putative XAP5 protein [Cyclospora cayetanensis]|uniref:XAP5 protein n=1 Tax=Cyclospora cayetanensis TaxID=88456 RepID=A0A1D3CRK7_9EIME|nr:putative XAP5 protein [Cyclospora cayetanensis]